MADHSKPIHFEQILKQYWGYDQFRPLQKDIVTAIYNGQDTLALLPTGGGKSICFQVPAMAMDGVCLVISPLIALMTDQVENLQKRNIKAKVVCSGMSEQEIEDAFNAAIYGNLKFLYLSPERLSTTLFLNKVKQMTVSFIAVDEAHCISQWGYDFRPSYLKIADIRTLLPDVSILALTATATPQVVEDIMAKLQFATPHVLSKSFSRPNLAYIVLYKENKLLTLQKLLQQIEGSGLVYCSTRKGTEEAAKFLTDNGFIADFYHAGLSSEERKFKQEQWKSGKIPVIAATNAFGMGIDKSDVRYVVHVNIPASIEAYFQEAGRAGRDEQKAYAIMIYNSTDKQRLSSMLTNNFPPVVRVKEIYQQIASYLQIAYGSGKGHSFDFNLIHFCMDKKLPSVNVYAILKILEIEGYLVYNDDTKKVSSLRFVVLRDQLYQYHLKNSFLDDLLTQILRNYTGVFSDYQVIDESYLARKLEKSEFEVYEGLKKLKTLGVIDYIPRKIHAQITFLTERLQNADIYLSPQNYKARKERETEKIEAMLGYAEISDQCRSQLLLKYFGQNNATPCGMCDYCVSKNQLKDRREEILTILSKSPKNISEFLMAADFLHEEEYLYALQRLQNDGEVIVINGEFQLKT